jgi:16S rRNA (cytosine967-C5)-methyltransferase
MNTRAAAALILFEVIHEGYSLSDALTDGLKKFPDKRDQAFIQALCYGVCRWYFRLDAIATLLLDRPMKPKDLDVYVLILMGIYQLSDMRIPDYAAVGETVAATQTLEKLWAKNFVNGVLRQYQRSADELNAIVEKNLSAVYVHPEWLIDKVKRSWPDHWESILDANNQHPPFTLRVNQLVASREDYVKILSEKIASLPEEDRCEVFSVPEIQSGIILEKAMDVLELPGFSDGSVSVQDAAAQLAAELLMLEPGQSVLDACAAPGGKTAHILEIQPDIAELLAVDHDEHRLDAVCENLQRLKLSADCAAADVGDIAAWWDEKPFDRILLDAPCSASGVIRRHPDIKLLRRASDIPKLAEEQKRILNSLWQTLKPGGILLYATCSIFPEENELVIKDFLEEHADAAEEKINAEWGIECSVGRQILPGMHKMDGFYYARLKKIK